MLCGACCAAVEALVAVASRPTGVTHIWALHGLWLVACAAGVSYAVHVKQTLQLALELVVSVLVPVVHIDSSIASMLTSSASGNTLCRAGAAERQHVVQGRCSRTITCRPHGADGHCGSYAGKLCMKTTNKHPTTSIADFVVVSRLEAAVSTHAAPHIHLSSTVANVAVCS